MLREYDTAMKFRLYPTGEQAVFFAKNFGCVRFVFNHFLDRRKTLYEEDKKSMSYKQCAKELVALKKEKDTSFLAEIDSVSLQQSLKHLDKAFSNFFKGNAGYPKFKSKKDHHHSYTTVCVNHNIRIDGNKIILPKVGAVRMKVHRKIPDNYVLKSVTVSKGPSGKYYASIHFTYQKEEPVSENTKAIGLDFSMPGLFVSSERGYEVNVEALHWYRDAQDKLAREQRILSRRKKGSKRYEKQRIKVARLHEKITNQRSDYLHKVSRQITNDFDIVCIEDLNMKAMAQCFNFGKAVSDNGWGMFTTMLGYKLDLEGKTLVKVGRFYPSSKTCSVCGYKNHDLTLNDRIWECPDCHQVHDRDYNAAVNIKKEGLRLLLETA